MLADKVTITFDVITVLLVLAVVFFLLASTLLQRFVKVRPWFLPLGLACFAGAALAQHWGF